MVQRQLSTQLQQPQPTFQLSPSPSCRPWVFSSTHCHRVQHQLEIMSTEHRLCSTNTTRYKCLQQVQPDAPVISGRDNSNLLTTSDVLYSLKQWIKTEKDEFSFQRQPLTTPFCSSVIKQTEKDTNFPNSVRGTTGLDKVGNVVAGYKYKYKFI